MGSQNGDPQNFFPKKEKERLFNRRSKQKVQGRLLPAKVIVTGVDMGRSFSVLLFCIAMDPILHYLHRIPGVIAVQGYVDDTTLVGDDVDQFEWLACVGRLCKDLESAGILVEPHRCWRAECVNAPTCTPTQMEPGHPLEWLLRRFTYQALRVVLEPISRNRQQHCFKILWSFNFCPSGAVHRWSMVATLGVRRMASPELVIQSPQIRFHFRLYFSKKRSDSKAQGVVFSLQSFPLICKWAL